MSRKRHTCNTFDMNLTYFLKLIFFKLNFDYIYLNKLTEDTRPRSCHSSSLKSAQCVRTVKGKAVSKPNDIKGGCQTLSTLMTES